LTPREKLAHAPSPLFLQRNFAGKKSRIVLVSKLAPLATQIVYA